ncbi:MAG: Uma2 family endonuclease [Phycisphaerae bacterium]
MHDVLTPPIDARVPRYDGLRATADEYFELADDDFRYELIDGVIIMFPSPTPSHQRVAMEIAFQLESFLRGKPIGMLFHEVDVELDRKLVYRPKLVFVRRENLPRIQPRIRFAPDVVVEVVSPESRARDTRTKFADYQRFGVSEYWLVDPAEKTIRLFRMEEGAYVDVTPQAATFVSSTIGGFSLDLDAVRRAFRALG